jgi:anti-anti-sigma factor
VNAPLATVDVERHQNDVTAVVSGEIDLSNADEVQLRLEEAARGARAVTVDLRAVEYMDSRGVRLLHDLSRSLTADGVDLTVVAPADSIAGEILRLTQLPGLAPDPS